MKFKKIIIYFTAALLCLSLTVPLVCSAVEIDRSSDFVPSQTQIIGWDGVAVTVISGTFADADGKRVDFGILPGTLKETEENKDYPVYTYESETAKGLDCTLTLFADKVSDASDSVAVFCRLEVKNNTDTAQSFPTVKSAVRLSDVPETVKRGERFVCDFASAVAYDGERPSDKELASASYDEHLKNMKAHWDAVIKEKSLFSSIPKAAEKFENDYRRILISDAIGRADGSDADAYENLSIYELYRLVSAQASDKDSEYNYDALHDTITVRLQSVAENVRPCSGGEYLYSEESSPEYYSFDENIQALCSLSAGARALALIARAENRLGSGIGNGDEYTDIRVALEKLSAGISNVMERTVSALPYDWTAIDTAAYRKNGTNLYDILGFDDSIRFELSENSASLLSRWYVENLTLGTVPGGILGDLAKDAVDFSNYAGWDGGTFAASAAYLDSSNRLNVGTGLSASLLAGANGMLLNSIPGTDQASITVSTNENTIVFKLSQAKQYPIRISIPMLRDNIESASCAFDAEKGVLSAPAGTEEITVVTSTSPADKAADIEANTTLQRALLSASMRSTDSCTSISASRFKTAMENAMAARDGIADAEDKLEAAQELLRAAERLSETVAGYTVKLSDGEVCGSIKGNRVYQKITFSGAGSLKTVYAGGTLPEGVTASVYTLKSDGYTPDAKIYEAVGTADKNGCLFEMDPGVEIEPDTEYALCFSTDSADASENMELRVLSSTQSGTLYVSSTGSAIAYRLCTLDVTVNVTQADRSELDSLYRKCCNANVTGYTKESVKRLRSAMNDAAEALCTPHEEVSHCEEVYNRLHKAFVGLSTYASDEKPSNPPAMLYVLLGTSAVLLCGALLIAASSGKKNAGK